MEIFPAIDIHAGHVVRASRRGLEGATVHHADPIALAERYQDEGARWLHVVDLDRAFGVGDQTPLVAALVKRLTVPVQVGGGLWTLEAVEDMRDIGVQRMLLGARAVATPPLLAAIVDQFSSDSLGLALDAREGRLWSRQWEEAARFSPLEIAVQACSAGVATVVLTELSREGGLGGADVEGARALAQGAGVEVIVSGGVNGLDDLRRIRDAGLAGAVIGRGLLEQRFTLREALACTSS